MKKEQRTIKLGNGDVRYEVAYSSDKIPDTELPKVKAMELFKTLSENPMLLLVNGQFFQKLVVQNDGEKWVAKLEVVINEN